MSLLTVVVNSSADHFEIILRNVENYIGLHFGLHLELHSEMHETENELLLNLVMYCSIFIRAEVDHFCFLRLISCGVPLIPSVGNTKLLLIGAGFLLEKLFLA